MCDATPTSVSVYIFISPWQGLVSDFGPTIFMRDVVGVICIGMSRISLQKRQGTQFLWPRSLLKSPGSRGSWSGRLVCGPCGPRGSCRCPVMPRWRDPSKMHQQVIFLPSRVPWHEAAAIPITKPSEPASSTSLWALTLAVVGDWYD